MYLFRIYDPNIVRIQMFMQEFKRMQLKKNTYV